MYEVNGAEQLADLARRLKAAGEKDLSKQLSAAIGKALKPVRQELPKSARGGKIPRAGGLADRVARSKIRTNRRTSGRAVGVRLRAENPDNIRRMDVRGEVRHLTFGHGPWVTQKIQPGWFTEPTEAAAPQVRAQITAAMTEITAEIDGKTPPP